MDPILGSIGSLFATGPGVLVMALATAAAVILWRWPVALAVLVFVNVGACASFVYLHGASGLLAGGQMLAITLAVVMLGTAQWLHPPSLSLNQPRNWPVRAFALLFIVGAWWFVAPDWRLPEFTLPETDLLLWLALCGLAIVAQTNNPLFFGVGLLFWSTATFAIALVLLPGSGLAALLGISEIMVALACSYLILAEPGATTVRVRQVRQTRASPPGLAPRLTSNPLTRRMRPSAPVAVAAAPVVAGPPSAAAVPSSTSAQPAGPAPSPAMAPAFPAGEAAAAREQG